MKEKLKKVYRWLFGDQGTLVGVSDAFALVTVINSVMMVTGFDTPKVGVFAYVHLLIRLGIIFAVFLLWDYDGVKSDIAYYREKIKMFRQSPTLNVAALSTLIVKEKFNATCVAYTLAVVLICMLAIVGATFGIFEPTGGVGFYTNIIALYVGIVVAVLVVSVIDTLRQPKK